MLDLHICIVSAQPTPNLTPIMDARVKPRAVLLLVSQDMKSQAQWLEDVLKRHAVKVHQHKLRSDPWNIEELRDEIQTIVSNIRDKKIALNVTGGTKPMAISAHEVFHRHNLPIFYVHPEKDRLIWLNTNDPAIDLDNKVRMYDFLAAHGYKVMSSPNRAPVPPAWKKLTSELINGIDRYGRPLGIVNSLASTAERSLKSEEIRPENRNNRDLLDLLNLFEKHGFLHLREHRLVFPDEERRFFVNGGWLEYHVKGILDNLRPNFPIQDIVQGIEVCHAERSRVINEIDVAFLAENRLYLIECKTKKFNRADNNVGPETLYKLDTLREVGGDKAKGMLVSFQELPSHDNERAMAMKIKTVVGRGIQRLDKEIAEWITR